MTQHARTPACDRLQPDLSEFVDGTLAADRRAEIVAHVAACAACEGLIADLRRLRAAASALGPIDPPDHVWLALAKRIPQGDRTGVEATDTPRSTDWIRQPVWQWLGLAAALVLVTLSIDVVAPRTPVSSAPVATAAIPAPSNAAATPSVESVEDDLRQAQELYASAITKLETIAKANDSAIAPDVAATLQHSLTTIDQAIAESRTALNQHPENVSARDSLFEALRRKVGVLEDAVALINVMRNGDPAGAAKIVGRKSSS